MSSKPPHDPDDTPATESSIAEKFPGLAARKPVTSISVQRPVDRDEKVVIESYADTEVVTTSKQPADWQTPDQKSSDSEPDTHEPSADETVLALPLSPEHRRARRRRRGWLIAAISLVVLVAGWAVLYFTPLLAIEDIEHEGLDLVAASEAQQRSSELLGVPLPQVTDRTVTELFEDNPAVKAVTLRAEPPHGIVVIVEEHTPIAMSPRGKQYVVFSNAGVELAEIPAKRAQAFDLPVVASASDVVDQEVFDTITEVLGSLPDELRDQVRAASGASIDSIELELSSGKTVMWGNTDQPERKARVLDALLGLGEEQAAEITEYDVSAPDFPVTR